MKNGIMFKVLSIAVFFCFMGACSSQAPNEQSELENDHDSALSRLNEDRLEDFSKNNGKVQVYLVVKSVGEAEILQLKEVGAEIEIVNKKLNKIQAMVDKDKLNELRMLDNVLSITNPSYGHLRSHAQ